MKTNHVALVIVAWTHLAAPLMKPFMTYPRIPLVTSHRNIHLPETQTSLVFGMKLWTPPKHNKIARKYWNPHYMGYLQSSGSADIYLQLHN